MPDTALRRLAQMGSPGNWLIAAIEGVQESHGTGRFDPGFFHPSDFGNDCDAFLAFRYLGAPAVQSIAARTQRIFDLGNARDLALKKDMKRAGVSLIRREEDRKIYIPHLHIRGELDDWVMNPVTHLKYVVDIKTMRPDEWDHLEAVKHAHFLQLHPYMYDKETYKGLVLYENKGSQELKMEISDFNGRVWQTEIVERVGRIITGLDMNIVYRNPVRCSSCPFFSNGVCTSNDIARLKEASGLY